MTYILFILTFLLGSVTLPLLCFLSFWLLSRPATTSITQSDPLHDARLDHDLAEKSHLKSPQDDPPTAAGYFAVCREYVPAGINGKPPERSSPAGDVQLGTSPSVYQSMYNSIFDRGKTTVPSIDGDKKEGPRTKKARNVFYVALRHDHLLLFDTEQQLEVRHVISLLHHQVDIYAGGDVMSEGDLFIKRNCIRLQRPAFPTTLQPTSKPFYLFSENCSDKEDFYHALLAAQTASAVENAPATPMKYEPRHMLKLVQALHTSDADPHSKWLNALIGRLFLGLYKVQQLEDTVKAKITRKIDRVPKPTFVSSVTIQSVDIGDAAPVFSNFRLKELNIDEDVVLEADVKYNGGFRLQIAAVARLDLGQRFRAREVNLLLAVVLKRLSGHMHIRIKAPPSNRIWVAFETMPTIELNVEPIVSSRQITYGVILRAIESRIREVLAETLVMPNWDDFPFLDTTDMAQRGGIWQHHTPMSAESEVLDDSASGKLETVTLSDTDREDTTPENPVLEERAMSMPVVKGVPADRVVSRKALRNKRSVDDTRGISSGSSMASIAASKALTNIGLSTPRSTSAKIPKAMKSPSFAAKASPIVNTDDARPCIRSADSSDAVPKREAMDLIKDVKQRSDSFGQRPVSSDESLANMDADRQSVRSLDPSTDKSLPRSDSGKSDATSLDTPQSSKHASTTSLVSTINSSTAAAKQWGWNVINRSSPSRPGSNTSMHESQNITSPATPNSATLSATPSSSTAHPGLVFSSTTASSSTSSFAKTFAHMRGSSTEPATNTRPKVTQSGPMGRGQPLPAPGQPLPGPVKPGWGGVLGGFKKKGVSVPATTSTIPGSEAMSAIETPAGGMSGGALAATPVTPSARSGSKREVAPQLPPRLHGQSGLKDAPGTVSGSVAGSPGSAQDVLNVVAIAKHGTVDDLGTVTEDVPGGSEEHTQGSTLLEAKDVERPGDLGGRLPNEATEDHQVAPSEEGPAADVDTLGNNGMAEPKSVGVQALSPEKV